MKKKFSKEWKASKQPRKQRKYRANAPVHIKRKFLSANLSKELRKRYLRRSFPLRKSDAVRIMRGDFKGKKGKIDMIEVKRTRVAIEGIQRAKKDGTKVRVFFSPSKLQIQELNLEDKKRIKSLERKIFERSKEGKEVKEKKESKKQTKLKAKEEKTAEEKNAP